MLQVQVRQEDVVRGVLPLLGTVLVYYLAIYLFRRPAVFDAPLEGDWKPGQGTNSAAANTVKTLKANYRKYRDRFFKINGPSGETVVLPVRYLEELKALPQDVLSFEQATHDRMMGKYTMLSTTMFGNHGRTLPNSTINNLTRNLSVLMPAIHEETNFAFEKHIGPCEDWTEVKIFEKLVTIIALVSGRIFIGPEMNRDPEYMRCIISYTIELFKAVGAVQSIRPWLRGLYCTMGWVPEVNEVYAMHAKMQRIMEPIITQRTEAMAADEELPNDMVTWNLLNSPPSARNVKAQAYNQMMASMAAIHTTSMTGSHVLYDLAFRPELQEPLRAELQSVMAAERVPYLSKTSTPKLRLLDSFCRESQRMNPPGQLVFNRKVMRDITLHDGTVLPRDTFISVALAGRMGDEDVYADPATFDAWRFVRLRERKGEENRHQFVTSSPDNLSFGYGNHACPGRFFANNELKVILAHVLAHYDIKLPEGETRPENIPTAGGARPDTSKAILMRKRADIPV